MLGQKRTIGRAHDRTLENVLQMCGERRIEPGMGEHGGADTDLTPGVAFAIDNAPARVHGRELIFDALFALEQKRPPGGEARGRGDGAAATTG
jgi:hypothetical protein